MARQVGDILIKGTVAGITFYRMDGRWYARAKSSLSGRRVKRDPAFRRTMQSAGRLARGSQLASRVYRALEKKQQVYALYCRLKSQAIYTLKQGKEEAEVTRLLQDYLIETGVIDKKVKPRAFPGKIQSLFVVFLSVKPDSNTYPGRERVCRRVTERYRRFAPM